MMKGSCMGGSHQRILVFLSLLIKGISYLGARSCRFVLLCMALLIPFKSYAVVNPWKINIGGLYSEGFDDDLNAASNWYMLPFSLKYRASFWSVQFSGAYLESDGDQKAYSDFGDTQIKVSYLAPSPIFKHWWVDINSKVKIPTAGSNLGTGELDYWFDIDALRMFSKQGYIQVGGGKKIRGDSVKLKLSDSFYFSSGLGYQWHERHAAGTVIEYMDAANEWSTEIIELMLYGSYRLNTQNTLLLYAIKGFTESSINYGIGLQLSYRFAGKATIH